MERILVLFASLGTVIMGWVAWISRKIMNIEAEKDDLKVEIYGDPRRNPEDRQGLISEVRETKRMVADLHREYKNRNGSSEG